MNWDLNRLKTEVRLITGVYNDDISDDTLVEMIQHFWRVTLPATLKLESQKETFRFLTRIGLALYPMPEQFVSLTPQAFIENRNLQVTYDETVLSTSSGHWHTEVIGSGAGTQDIYTHTLSEYPEPQSICVFTNEETVYWGDPRIKYTHETKTILVDLYKTVPKNDHVIIKYRGTRLAAPFWLLVKDHTLTLSPTPGQNYMIEVTGLKRPDPLPFSGDFVNVPEEYMDLVVYGAALKIFALTDSNGYNRIYPIYQQAESVAMSKTHQQLLYTQIQGI